MIRDLLTRAHRVLCRTEHGNRSTIDIRPRPDGKGVRLRCEGGLLLTPLEVGRLRAALREAVLASESTVISSSRSA
ncbi:MAG: hypothetical protein ABIQ18_12185 [Umezawaea sp.]